MSDKIEKTITLRAPVDRVWRAITDPVEFGQWFRVKLENDFVVGQVSRGRITYPGFEHATWEATVAAIEPKTRFAFTWRPYAVDPKVDYSAETPTLVEFRLTPTPEGTQLVITESGFDKVPAWRREEAMRMNDGGWAEQIENIRAHVDG